MIDKFLAFISEIMGKALGKIITSKDLLQEKNPTKLTEFIINLLTRVERLISTVVPASVLNSYKEGLKAAEKNLVEAGVDNVIVAGIFSKIHQEAITAITEDTMLDLHAAVRTAKKMAKTNIDKVLEEVRNDIKNGLLEGNNNEVVSKRVAQTFAKNGLTSFITSDGKNLPLDFYAKTVVKTKMREANTVGAVNRYLENDVQLVQIDDHKPTCHVCARYEGMVISLTGKHEGFKSIKDTGVKLPPYHPHCEHTIRPFVIKNKTDDEIQTEKDKWKKWNPEKDTRTEAQKKAYEKEQAIRRVANQEKKQYANMKAVLGYKAPKTIGAYRRMKRKNDEKWMKLQSEYLSAARQI